MSADSFMLPSAVLSNAITAAFDRQGLSNFVHVFNVQEFRMFKQLDDAVCTTCAPGDQEKSHHSQCEKAF